MRRFQTIPIIFGFMGLKLVAIFLLVWIVIFRFNMSSSLKNNGYSYNPFDQNFVSRRFDEGSCMSTYAPLLHHRSTLRKASPYFVSKLRSYEARHKRCAPYTFLYNKTVDALKGGISNMKYECEYNVWFPIGGLGNRMMSLASAFLYALLTDRVLLIDPQDSISDLFCEPFPESSWLLPLDFPLLDTLRDFNKNSPDSFGELLRNNLLGDSNRSRLHPYVYVHLYSDYGDLDKSFYCEHEHSYVQDVPWLIMMSELYYAPSFFSMLSFEKELRHLFPDKETVFHFLGRYLFHPSNSVWGLVTRFYEAYLNEADVKVGIQIRVFQHETTPFENILNQILSCTMNEGLLPRVYQQQQELPSSKPLKKKKKKIAVLMTSLSHDYYKQINKLYWENPTVTGEIIAIHQPSFEEQQNTGNLDHDKKALAEMYLLSLTDKLVTSATSTFGYVARSLGGLTPWMIFKSINETGHDEPCRRIKSIEPCFHVPPEYDCKMKRTITRSSALGPHIRKCEDLGVQLVDNHRNR